MSHTCLKRGIYIPHLYGIIWYIGIFVKFNFVLDAFEYRTAKTAFVLSFFVYKYFWYIAL